MAWDDELKDPNIRKANLFTAKGEVKPPNAPAAPPEKKKKKSTFWRLAKMAIMGGRYRESKDE